jgi:hypothetical protein
MKLLIHTSGEVRLSPADSTPSLLPGETVRDATTEEIALISQGGLLKVVGGVLTEVPIPPPAEVPLWRLKAIAAQVEHGDGTLLEAIDAAVASTPARFVWHNGNTIARESPTLAALAAGLGLTSAQVDEFFRQAAAIPI